jgi:hypothetical protein
MLQIKRSRSYQISGRGTLYVLMLLKPALSVFISLSVVGSPMHERNGVTMITIAILLQRPVYCFWRADFHGQGATRVTPDNFMYSLPDRPAAQGDRGRVTSNRNSNVLLLFSFELPLAI